MVPVTWFSSWEYLHLQVQNKITYHCQRLWRGWIFFFIGVVTPFKANTNNVGCCFDGVIQTKLMFFFLKPSHSKTLRDLTYFLIVG